jgi:hypothetical protein
VCDSLVNETVTWDGSQYSLVAKNRREKISGTIAGHFTGRMIRISH